ncbi:MAG: M16 family metallopeptidase [Bacteroidales bacterium]
MKISKHLLLPVAFYFLLSTVVLAGEQHSFPSDRNVGIEFDSGTGVGRLIESGTTKKQSDSSRLDRSQNDSSRLDRSVMPSPSEPKPIKIGQYKTYKLENGATLFLVRKEGYPKFRTSVSYSFPDINTDKQGLERSILSGMLSRIQTLDTSFCDLKEKHQRDGAQVSLSSQSFFVSGTKQNAGELFSLVAPFLNSAVLDKEVFEQIKNEELQKMREEASAQREAAQESSAHNSSAQENSVSAVSSSAANSPAASSSETSNTADSSVTSSPAAIAPSGAPSRRGLIFTDVAEWNKLKDSLLFNKTIYTSKPDFDTNHLKAITFENISDYFKKYINPNNAFIMMIGDFTFKEVETLVMDKFSAWEPGEAYSDDGKDYKLVKNYPKHTQIYFLHVPDATQSSISVTWPLDDAFPYAQNEPALKVLNQIFGESYSSYLNSNLRLDKGLTYGVKSFLNINASGGSIDVRTKVRSQETAYALENIFYEMLRIRNQLVSQETLQLAKNGLIGDYAVSMSSITSPAILGFGMVKEKYSLPDNYLETYPSKINAVTAQQVREYAQKYIKPNGCIIFIEGNLDSTSHLFSHLPGFLAF